MPKLMTLALVAATLGGGIAYAQSQGPNADTCGIPNPLPAAITQTYPAGQYPVKLPAVSLLGAHNDLPNPYRPGVDWGQLPPGRKWGSTASITTAPDGTIWVADRCGA